MKKYRRVFSALAALAIALTAVPGGVPLQAHAEEEWSKFDDGVTSFDKTGIGRPKAPEQASDAWTGSYVYYGQYDGQPVKYRVLDPDTSLFGGRTMLLDCDTTLFTDVFRNDWGPDDANVWAASDLYKLLNTNDDAFLKTSFTSAEATAIAESRTDAHELVVGENAGNVASYTQESFVNYTPLTGEKIFLLDVEDVSNTAYGYSVTNEGTENRKKKEFIDSDSNAYDWWLRSPHNIDYVGCVSSGGNIGTNDVLNTDIGVSPAFNVDLSSVMFVSQVNDETDPYGREYKLTLNDENLSVLDGRITRSGNTVTIPYKVTDKTPDDGITPNTVSVEIFDSNYTRKHYFPLEGEYAPNGIGTFELPDDYSETDIIALFAEDVNAQYETDYASWGQPIILPDPPQWSKFDEGVTTLGTAIGAPKAPERVSDAWTGSYVYYGQYNDQPVKYRVLDPDTSLFGGRTMLLDCDTMLFTDVFCDYDDASDANVWTASDLYKVLNTNDDAFLKTSFTGAEAAAIAESTRAAHELVVGENAGNVSDWTRDTFVNYTPLTGEKIFLLDAEDVSNIAYGYSVIDDDTENRKKKEFTDSDSNAYGWGLRSPSSRENIVVGYVDVDDGTIDSYRVNDDIFGVSPAFNVDLSSVVLASQVNDETGTYGREYKLTLKDSNTTVTAEKLFEHGGSILVKCIVTDNAPDDGITADTISLLITSDDGVLKYYAPLTNEYNPYSTRRNVTFDLPENIAETDHVYILAEDTHDGDTDKYLTDYASEPVEIIRNTYYQISVNNASNGTVTPDMKTAIEGETVTLNVTPDEGYKLKSLTVTDASENEIVVKSNRFTMPAENVTVNAEFTELDESKPEFYGHSLVLDGAIGLNFYVYIPENMADGAYMTFTVNGCETMQTISNSCTRMINGVKYYYGICYTTTMEMADDITATLHYSDDQTISDTYSISEYFEDSKNESFDEYTTSLIESISVYGEYAQKYLVAVHGINKYNAISGLFELNDGYVTFAKEILKNYELEKGENNSDITNIGYRLDLRSRTTLEVAVQLPEDYTGTVSATIEGENEPVLALKNNTYSVKITNIPAQSLGTPCEITFTTDSGSWTVKVSALTYANKLINNPDNEYAEMAMTALFYYSFMAASYQYEHSN